MSNLTGQRWIVVLLVFIVISAVFQFSSPKVFDPDAFYHLTHAKIYRAEGMTSSEFPWARFSVIKNLKADIWYGFHVLLIPLALFGNPVFGIKFGVFILTAAVLFTFFLVLKKFGVRWPLAWVLLFFFSVPDVHYRFLMLRPHLLTFALALVIFYSLTKKQYWGVMLASALLAFFHLALGWVAIFLAIAVLVADGILTGRANLKILIPPTVGFIAGALARPNFTGALKIAYVQVVQLMSAKFENIPLRLGSELKPGNSVSVLLYEILPISILVVAALAVIVVLRKQMEKISPDKKTALFAALGISIIFGFITVFVARRGIDFLAGFTVLTLALAINTFDLAVYFKKYKKHIASAALVFMAAILPNTLYFSLFKYPRQVPNHEQIKPAAEWLRDNSKNGEIVFHSNWDNFPVLFFYNQKNYYINGMDPIFLQASNPSLNIKLYFFAIDKLLFINNEAYTCGANPCVPGSVISAYDSIKNDFEARYVFVEPVRSPRFYQFLKNDRRFKESFASPQASVFEVL